MDFKITKERSYSGWVEGTADGYWFQAKVYDHPSEFGINNGRVSKLTICEGDEYDYEKQVYHYSRGLDVDEVDEEVLDSIVDFCEKKYGKKPETRKKITSKTLHIFDNEGETVDRYTILFPNGDVYGCSEKPKNPMGVASYSHNTDEEAQEFTWEGKKEFVTRARQNPDWIGKEIEFEEAPERIQKFIDVLFQTHYKDYSEYVYPLCYPDGEQFARVKTDCPPCRITAFRDKLMEEHISVETIDWVVASFLDLLNEGGYAACIAEEDEETDLIFNI